MYVETEPVADSVHVIFQVRFFLDQVFRLTLEQAKLLHTFGQKFDRIFLTLKMCITDYCEVDTF